MSSDTETKFQDWKIRHGQKEQGAGKAIPPDLANPDFRAFIMWLQTHSAFTRLTDGEIQQGLERANREAGYVLTRIAVNG